MSEKTSIVSSGLAGAAALAAASGAYAAIVPAASLPPITLTGAPGTFAQNAWDIDGDGFDDMIMLVANQAGPFTGTTWSSQVAMLGNSAVAYIGGFGAPYAYSLPAGIDVGSQNFDPGFGTYGQVILGSDYGGSLYGQFVGAGELGYLGIRFQNVSGDHFAWALVRSTLGQSLEVLGAYYNDTPLGAIQTGQVPAPGTLAALAFGAAAFSRRSRKNAS